MGDSVRNIHTYICACRVRAGMGQYVGDAGQFRFQNVSFNVRNPPISGTSGDVDEPHSQFACKPLQAFI